MGKMISGHVSYEYGNELKVLFRKHFCRQCGEKLKIIEHQKIVERNSDEGKHYTYPTLVGETFLFVHHVFHCPKCERNIEYITQLSYEDIDIIIQKTVNYFKRKGLDLTIEKVLEDEYGNVLESVYDLVNYIYLHLIIKEDGKPDLDYKVITKRNRLYERPFEFPLSKRKLIKFIKERKFVH